MWDDGVWQREEGWALDVVCIGNWMGALINERNEGIGTVVFVSKRNRG